LNVTVLSFVVFVDQSKAVNVFASLCVNIETKHWSRQQTSWNLVGKHFVINLSHSVWFIKKRESLYIYMLQLVSIGSAGHHVFINLNVL